MEIWSMFSFDPNDWLIELLYGIGIPARSGLISSINARCKAERLQLLRRDVASHPRLNQTIICSRAFTVSHMVEKISEHALNFTRSDLSLVVSRRQYDTRFEVVLVLLFSKPYYFL